MEQRYNAHTLTILFHRFLSQKEWHEVIQAIREHVPYAKELRADVVYELEVGGNDDRPPYLE